MQNTTFNSSPEETLKSSSTLFLGLHFVVGIVPLITFLSGESFTTNLIVYIISFIICQLVLFYSRQNVNKILQFSIEVSSDSLTRVMLSKKTIIPFDKIDSVEVERDSRFGVTSVKIKSNSLYMYVKGLGNMEVFFNSISSKIDQTKIVTKNVSISETNLTTMLTVIATGFVMTMVFAVLTFYNFDSDYVMAIVDTVFGGLLLLFRPFTSVGRKGLGDTFVIKNYIRPVEIALGLFLFIKGLLSLIALYF